MSSVVVLLRGVLAVNQGLCQFRAWCRWQASWEGIRERKGLEGSMGYGWDSTLDYKFAVIDLLSCVRTSHGE